LQIDSNKTITSRVTSDIVTSLRVTRLPIAETYSRTVIFIAIVDNMAKIRVPGSVWIPANFDIPALTDIPVRDTLPIVSAVPVHEVETVQASGISPVDRKIPLNFVTRNEMPFIGGIIIIADLLQQRAPRPPGEIDHLQTIIGTRPVARNSEMKVVFHLSTLEGKIL
jgi:hypothetical protein